MILDLPDIRQQDDWSCGTAILTSLHSYWEKPLKPALGTLSNPTQGMSPDTFDAVLRASGFMVMSGNLNLSILKALTGTGYPIACLVQFEKVGHYVLCAGVERGKVYFNCPLRGKCSESTKTWLANWWDTHWLGYQYNNWGTCCILQE